MVVISCLLNIFRTLFLFLFFFNFSLCFYCCYLISVYYSSLALSYSAYIHTYFLLILATRTIVFF